MVQNKQSFSTSHASLSSSFSSSAASSMLLPAAPPSTSSHSDITTSDQVVSAPSTTFKSIFGGPAFSHLPRSSPPTSSMGQVVSRPQVTATFPPSSAPSSLGNAASNTGNRLKRAFVGRRNKSDGVTSSSAPSPKISRGKEPESGDSPYGSTNSAPRQLGAKQLTLQLAQHVFSKKHSGSAPASPAMGSLSLPPPPPPPPKHTQQLSLPSLCLAPVNTNIDKRVSVMTTSSPIVPALDYMRKSDEHVGNIALKENERKDPERSESKEIRRKSDSTLSHHTIRPGLGSRTPRPVSLAESLQSTHTIMPVNKRLSALITDAEYIMPEEEDGEGRPPARSASPGRRASPVPSLRVRDRRSQSLNLGPPLLLMASAPTAANASLGLDVMPSPLPGSVSEERQRERLVTREMATATFSSLPSGVTRPAGVALRANLVPSVDFRSNSPLSRVERTLPDLPQPPRRAPLASQPNHASPSFRQTAISMTSGFAPAAGLARRAVEKMGRVWGSKSLSPSPLASPVGTPPSPFSTGRAGPPSRAGSNHSESTHHGHGKKSRHNPQAPSVSSTGSSLSDHEGPQLGKRLRGPVRISPTSVGVAGGLVFGRDLRTCVKDTAIDSVRNLIRALPLGPGNEGSKSSEHLEQSEPSAVLDSRYVPALVVRCAQHILAWGVQEQGLFRVSGRSSHVAKLRAEFDTGADFDIVQSNPGDLDPHAVASIFKAYLRELPEPILTNHLMPYFDAAMASERLTNNAQDPPPPRSKNVHPGLRKPPSLSTLSMPIFGGAHPPSDSLRKALSSLIARLPQENRDLLLTVTEVINHTAKRSSETKMPLSNLLLVLCPSLSMNPSLLQALCESEDIWSGVQSSKEAKPLNAITEDALQSPVERLEGQDERQLPPGADKNTLYPKSSNESKRFARPLPNVPIEDFVPPPESIVGSGLVNVPNINIPASPVSVSEPSSPCPSQDTIPRVPIDSSETVSSFSTTDDSSSVSHFSQGGRPVTPTSVNLKLTNSYSPPSLSCSTDSLSVPSLSSGSSMHLVKPLPLVDCEPQSSNSPHSPIIAEPIPLPIPHLRPRQPVLQAQFHFPGTGDNVTRSPLTHRTSTPSMSLSSSSSAEVRSASLTSRVKRLKKPSLHLLFTRRSASPMSSPATQSSAIGASSFSTHKEGSSRSSSASESSPDSMVTAPQSSRFSYPPVLNTAIDESSISLALGIEDGEEDHATSVGHTIKDGTIKDGVTSLQVSMTPNIPVPHGRTSPPSATSKEGPFRHLDISLSEDGELGEDSWTQSVLLAAGESSW
ncbi:RhoGAP-domain-containing protein [Gyrodon lividus]|nr:RhoGAP-domain-containing protein [Gyrodon lividus]